MLAVSACLVDVNDSVDFNIPTAKVSCIIPLVNR